MARNGKRSRSRSRDKQRRRGSASPSAVRQFKSGRGSSRGTAIDGLFSYVPDLERYGHLVGEATSGNIPWEGRLRGPDAPTTKRGYRPTTPTPTTSGRQGRRASHHSTSVKVPPQRALPRPRDLHPPIMFSERGPETRKHPSPLFADSSVNASTGQMGAPNGAASHQSPLTHPKRLSFVKQSREELLGRWRRDHEEEMCCQQREPWSQLNSMASQAWSPSADSSSASAVEARQREWEAHQERQRYTNWKIHPRRSSTPVAWQSGGSPAPQSSSTSAAPQPVMDNLPPMKLFTRRDYSPVESSPGPDESPSAKNHGMGLTRRGDQPAYLGVLDSPVITPPKSRHNPRRDRGNSEDDWIKGQWEDESSSCEEDSQTGSPEWFTSTSETSPDSHSPYYRRTRSRSRSRSGRGKMEASWTPTAAAQENWARGLRGATEQHRQQAGQMWR